MSQGHAQINFARRKVCHKNVSRKVCHKGEGQNRNAYYWAILTNKIGEK